MVRLINVENITPILPIANNVTNKNKNTNPKSTGEIPPNRNTKLYIGSAATINNNKNASDENNFPVII